MAFSFPPQSFVVWGVILSLLHLIAIGSTVFRIVHRYRTKKLWWDDYLAFIPLTMDCALFIQLWCRFSRKFVSRDRMIESFWLASFLFLSVVWFSRMSLSLSVARIFPQRHKARRGGFILAVTFLLYAGSIILVTLTCRGGGRTWYRMESKHCLRTRTGHYIGGLTATALDIAADAALIVYPLYVFWRVRLPRNQKRLVLVVSCASGLTLLSAVLLCIFWYGGINMGPHGSLLRSVTAQIEATISLIVCNLLVVTMFFYRLCRRIHNIEDSSGEGSDDSEMCSTRSVQPKETSYISSLTDVQTSGDNAGRQLGMGDLSLRYSAPFSSATPSTPP
ncbi:unnamed protein product [Cyclocybe aegerita]|uniref:Rhodopsin domain-containing protein n=1 Tax=Cyclocybe aegerita TaxID=1973307 RepID=A0A8S0W7Q8_CYCAE|nr:unnamed protein product [Cyclocybe aegerita]